MSESEVQEIQVFLKSRSIPFEVLIHKPVFTSEEAARERGMNLRNGVKALFLKSKSNEFILACIAADRKIDLKKLESFSGLKKLKLASPEEVKEKTNCEIGSVPPFMNLKGFKVFFDNSLLENELAEFNIGMHTHSIRMKLKDLVQAIQPIIADYSKE